jgi:hypothetical protein
MTAFRFGHLRSGLLLAAVTAISMFPAAGQAYTPEQEQACTGDAFRLCSSEIPNVDRVTACMVAKRAQLSPGCRAQFRPDPPAASVQPVGQPKVIRPAPPRKAATSKARKVKKPKPKPAT